VAVELPAECRELLELQHGVIARTQALRSGLAAGSLDNRLRYGRWRPLYRGVYLTFTGEAPRLTQLWGAVLRCGPGAALSHHTAAELDNLADIPAPAIHVMIDSGRRVASPNAQRAEQAPAIVLHHSARLTARRHPSRTPPRTRIEETTLDLADTCAEFGDALAWVTRACGRRLTTASLLGNAMAARAKVRWRAELAEALCLVASGVHSGLEWRYVRHVERPHGLPAAVRQARSRAALRTRYLDNLYAEFQVAVELDGQAAHPAEARWRDVHRDNASAALGIITLRYGWADVTRNPCRVAGEIAQVLRLRGWTGYPRPCTPACPLPPRPRPRPRP
jgi:hypothetical protein